MNSIKSSTKTKTFYAYKFKICGYGGKYTIGSINNDIASCWSKLGDGVLVRVVPAKDANIYTAFGTGLLGTCIKCLPQNDCSVVKIEPNLLLKEGFIGTFANGWLSIRYKDHFAQEKCNFIISTTIVVPVKKMCARA